MTLKQITGKRNRKNGMSFESKIFTSENSNRSNMFSLHSDGSRGLFDVVSLTKSGKLKCIVCRTNGYLTPKEHNQLYEFMINAPEYVQVELHYKKSERKRGKNVLTIKEV